jgi:hypothetical protein
MEFETLGQWLMGIPFLAVALVAALDGLLRRPARPKAASPGAGTLHAGTAGEAGFEDDLKKAA